MTFALDTDIFTLLVLGQSNVTARYARVIASGSDEVTIPAVARIEVLRGRFDAVTKAADGPAWVLVYDRLVRTEAALSPFRILSITQAAGAMYDQLRRTRNSRRATVVTCSLQASSSPMTPRWSRATRRTSHTSTV